MAQAKKKPTSSYARVVNVDAKQTDWQGRKLTRIDLRDGVHVYVPQGHALTAARVGHKLSLYLGK